jgi:hypothetical protein
MREPRIYWITNMQLKQLALTISVLACGLATTPTSAELIVNGGFEAPLVTNSGPPPGLGFDYKTGTQITGWTITGAKEPLFNTIYQPVGGGNQALQLESLFSVFQTFATTAGQAYVLTFDLAAYNMRDRLLQIAPLEVIVDGVTANFIGDDFAYVTETVPFTATGASTTVSFRNTGLFGVNFPQIDDVSVVAAVPEPASVALLGIGFAALGLTRRRKKV